MATKENKRQVRELVEGLEQRIHCGPAIQDWEIPAARDFLRRHDFAPNSDYFSRLTNLESRQQGRARRIFQPQVKRNYGGKAGRSQMQVQSIFDHVILSTCYAGDFNNRRGRIKISHRFNLEGRIDFVELKFLNSMQPLLNGELRKLLLIKNYAAIQKEWYEAEASVLEVLPQELIFLHADIFRCPKSQLFAGLLNLGHELVEELLKNLKYCNQPANPGPNLGWSPEAWNQNGNGGTVCLERPRTGCAVVDRNGNGFGEPPSPPVGYPGQLPLDALLQDEVAMPILEKASRLESVVEIVNSKEVLVRYLRQIQDPTRII